MIVSKKKYERAGIQYVQVTATDYREFVKLITTAKEHREYVNVIHRDRPTYKKGGHDHLRINITDPRGLIFVNTLFKPPHNGVSVSNENYELASYQLKISRLKFDNEWTHETREYMHKWERLRLVAVLKKGGWLTTEDLSPEQELEVRKWQRELKAVPLGRNSQLRYAPIIQNEKYSREDKLDRLQREVFPRNHVEESAEEKLLRTGDLDSYEESGGGKMELIQFLMGQGKINPDQVLNLMRGPMEDILKFK